MCNFKAKFTGWWLSIENKANIFPVVCNTAHGITDITTATTDITHLEYQDPQILAWANLVSEDEDNGDKFDKHHDNDDNNGVDEDGDVNSYGHDNGGNNLDYHGNEENNPDSHNSDGHSNEGDYDNNDEDEIIFVDPGDSDLIKIDSELI